MRFVSMLLAMTCSLTVGAKLDPKHYVNWLGPNTCAECHEDEARIWSHAHHSTSFKNMPRSKEGQEIAKKLGVSRIKTSAECGVCHVTYTSKDGKKLEPEAGVSCESCHGPAKNWNEVHQDYGGKNVTENTETAAHKNERWKKAEQGGMIRPIRKYKIFRQCYQCHTMTDETLLNKTEHPIGDEFELVKWSNGEVRHNVWRSKGHENKIRPPEQLRVRYILGQALAVEFALRGLAKATAEGKYTEAMIKRIKAAQQQLETINSKVNIPEIAEIIASVKSLELKSQNKDTLINAAEKISELTQKFIEHSENIDLKAIDNLLPNKFKGEPKLGILKDEYILLALS